MKTTRILHSFGLLLAMLVSGSAWPTDLPKEGSYDIKTCFTRNSTYIEYSLTQFAYSYEEAGLVVSSPPGGLFDQEEVRCVGMTASMAGQRTGGAVCIGVAKDGDRRLTRFTYDTNGRVQREAVSGTGKYDGLVLAGSTVQNVGPAPDPKAARAETCNRQTGSYKLR